MKNIVICDDDPLFCSQLSAYLCKPENMCGENVTIQRFSSGEELLAYPDLHADIIILDIQMAQLDGIETARQLRQRKESFLLIFVTSLNGYELNGYDVHAFGFLKKPLQKAKLHKLMQDALERLAEERGKIIELKRGMETDYINIREILYIEVYNHNICLVLPDARVEYYARLRDMEAQLNPHGFFRCHKSYLVSCSHIRTLRQTELVMENGEKIPISRNRRTEFLNYFTKYARKYL